MTQARWKTDLILSYGKKVITALEVEGVRLETASRILEKCMSKKKNSKWTCLKRRRNT